MQNQHRVDDLVTDTENYGGNKSDGIGDLVSGKHKPNSPVRFANLIQK